MEGALAEEPVYEDGRPVKVVIHGRYLIRAKPRSGPGREQEAVEAEEDDRPASSTGRRPRRRPEAIELEGELDPFKERLKEGDQVTASIYHRGDARHPYLHHYIRREDEPPRPQYDKHNMPRLLFLSAGLMTLVTLLVLWAQLPGLFFRTRLWFRWRGRAKLEVLGLHHLPDNGPVLAVSPEDSRDGNLQVLSCIDRTTLLLEPGPDGANGVRLREKGIAGLRRGLVVLLALDGKEGSVSNQLYEELTRMLLAPVVPVHRAVNPLPEGATGAHTVYVVVGFPLPAGAAAGTVRQEGQKLAEEFKTRLASGLPRAEAFVGAH
jgi:hypothetical protein